MAKLTELKRYLVILADRRRSSYVQTASVSTHCHDREYMRVRIHQVEEKDIHLTIVVAIVQEVQTQTLTTAHKATRATNLPVCERFEHVTIRMNRREGELSS